MSHERGILQRNSTRVFLGGVAFAILAFASAAYLNKQKRDFSAPTTTTMGTVVKKGSFWGRRSRSSESLCWVSYEFTAPDGVTRRNWRMWEPACGVSAGRPIPIQHVIANPDINRPGGSEPWLPAGLLFFAAGVAVVVGFIMRRSEEDLQNNWRTMDL